MPEDTIVSNNETTTEKAEVVRSKNFNIVKTHYEDTDWNIDMVRDAVVKLWITEDEFFEITGEKY